MCHGSFHPHSQYKLSISRDVFILKRHLLKHHDRSSPGQEGHCMSNKTNQTKPISFLLRKNSHPLEYRFVLESVVGNSLACSVTFSDTRMRVYSLGFPGWRKCQTHTRCNLTSRKDRMFLLKIPLTGAFKWNGFHFSPPYTLYMRSPCL